MAGIRRLQEFSGMVMRTRRDVIIRGRIRHIWRPITLNDCWCAPFLVAVLRGDASVSAVVTYTIWVWLGMCAITLPAWIVAALPPMKQLRDDSSSEDLDTFSLRFRCGTSPA